jgi:hypothetical protein
MPGGAPADTRSMPVTRLLFGADARRSIAALARLIEPRSADTPAPPRRRRAVRLRGTARPEAPSGAGRSAR